MRFDPEIIVIAGKASEPGGQELLQRNFPLMYTVANNTILDKGGKPLGNISMEEPFNSHPVRGYVYENVYLAWSSLKSDTVYISLIPSCLKEVALYTLAYNYLFFCSIQCNTMLNVAS